MRRFLFAPDPPEVELLKTPQLMLEEAAETGHARGDCDDAAILGASLALRMGLQARFVVLGFEPNGPYGHVYAEVWDGRRWLDLDVTAPAQFPPGLRIHRKLILGV